MPSFLGRLGKTVRLEAVFASCATELHYSSELAILFGPLLLIGRPKIGIRQPVSRKDTLPGTGDCVEERVPGAMEASEDGSGG